MLNSTKAIIVLILLVIALIAYIIFFGKGEPRNGLAVDTKPMRDSINILIRDRQEIETKIRSLSDSYDSLLVTKQKVKHIYNEKYKFIFTADPAKLDSIIRNIAGI